MQRNITEERAALGPMTIVQCRCGAKLDALPPNTSLASAGHAPPNAIESIYVCPSCQRRLRVWRSQ